jgi:hypothetical protein
MNHTARRVTKYCLEVYKLIIFLHQKNSHALCSWQCTSHSVALSCELINSFKNIPVDGKWNDEVQVKWSEVAAMSVIHDN